MKKLGVIGLVLILSLVGCFSKLTNDNLEKVKNGMTQDEVKAILGAPSHIETGEMPGIQGTTYYYKSGETEVKVVFLNNAVMVKEGSFK